MSDETAAYSNRQLDAETVKPRMTSRDREVMAKQASLYATAVHGRQMPGCPRRGVDWEQTAYVACAEYATWRERITYAWGHLAQATKELTLLQIQAVQRGLDRAIKELQP